LFTEKSAPDHRDFSVGEAVSADGEMNSPSPTESKQSLKY